MAFLKVIKSIKDGLREVEILRAEDANKSIKLELREIETEIVEEIYIFKNNKVLNQLIALVDSDEDAEIGEDDLKGLVCQVKLDTNDKGFRQILEFRESL